MATLYITEFKAIEPLGKSWGAQAFAQAAAQPAVAEQTVAIGGSSVSSSAFNPATTFVRLHTDSTCSIEFGSGPTASATTARMTANQTEYFGVSAGMKVAVIANT